MRPLSVLLVLMLSPLDDGRTVPFVAKAIGHPIAENASHIKSVEMLKDTNFTEEHIPNHVAVKEVVLPFTKFAGV